MADLFSLFQEKAEKTLQHIRQDISTLRTGRATVQMLDTVSVEAYGSFMKVNEVATVATPDPTLLVVTPWDKSILGPLEKAIGSAGINLHPIIDGEKIRITVPPLTQERRQEMVKQLHQKAESGRVLLRSIRAESRKEIEKMKDVGGVSEDQIKQDLQELEKRVKNFMDQLEKLVQDKEKELLNV